MVCKELAFQTRPDGSKALSPKSWKASDQKEFTLNVISVALSNCAGVVGCLKRRVGVSRTYLVDERITCKFRGVHICIFYIIQVYTYTYICNTYIGPRGCAYYLHLAIWILRPLNPKP